ncbi:LamG-like jellyroll fold domain-containing protein [Actinomycetes bacterium KLBMP 9797]
MRSGVFRSAIAAAVVVVLLSNLGGSGISGLPAGGRREAARPAAAPYPKAGKPGQRWASAAGQQQLTGKPGNTTVSPSLRSKYPPHKLDQKPPRGRNVASVTAAPPAKVRGFDPKASRLRPASQGAGTQVYDNADGTQTTVLSTLPVDPSAASGSMYVVQDGPSVPNGDTLRVGRSDGHSAASYVKFGLDHLQHHTVYGAALQIASYDAPSCRAKPVSVHPVTGSWSPGSGYAYPGPAVGGALATKSFAHGYIAIGQSQSACPAAPVLFDLGGGGRALVQRWVSGQQANNGLSLRASESDSGAWKRFAGSATANPPRLYVTHSPYNASYAIPNPVPDPAVLQNRAGKVKITVTNKSAEAWAPGSYYLAYRAYNAQTGAPVKQQRSANLTQTVARGARVTLDATIEPLPPGRYLLDFTMVRTGGAVFTDHQVPPGRIVLQVFNIAPVAQELYPPHGYQTPTLTPQLWATALDIDAPPGSALQYKFEVCDQTETGGVTGCTNSGFQAKNAWTVPAGRLVWSKNYQWRAIIKDTEETETAYSAILTAVPQPEITSRIAAAPYGTQDREFDAQVGNFSTVAVDATVVTVGPELNVVRTYNSLDPRRDSAFGAGWITRYDMKLQPDDDGSGNVVITYPDGQLVRFGRNADGTYAAPPGRTATLTLNPGTSFVLADKSGAKYEFGLPGATTPGLLTKITDSAFRAVKLTYNTSAKLAKAQVSNSLTNTAGRSLTFTWTGNHVTSVRTDPVGGTALTWNYTYDGDKLTTVCAPDTTCTRYDYGSGSHFRSAVVDAKPESYWRLGEAEGTAAGSEVAVNLGKDAGVYKNVTLGAAGALAGTDHSAATFNGTSSVVELPKGTLKKTRDVAVELWFKVNPTGQAGPLLGYQDKALGTAPGAGVPILYVGTDGRLRGQFATGKIAPIASSQLVNNGQWHHVVLSATGSTQTMYLNGVKVADLTDATPEHTALGFNQIGAAAAQPVLSWPQWGTTVQRHFNGDIDEVALYSHPIGPAAVATHHAYGRAAADQLTKVTLPSGRVAAEVSYDVGVDRVDEYTDRHGGTWKIGAPTVYGGDTDLRRGVQVLDPAGRPSLYEYDALAGRMLRTGTPTGISTRAEDRPSTPTTPSPSPSPTVCNTPDPGDPAFCTIIPGNAGGPVFTPINSESMSVRTYFYDDKGYQNKIVNEAGDIVEMTYDARGNVATKKTCRLINQCQTTYHTYPATVTNPLDPRNDLPIETRDGRSASATDNTYVTKYTYHGTGQLAQQINPDGSQVTHAYTVGAEAANGGNPPAGLVMTTTDPRSKVTRYQYYHNGDVYRITEPNGLVTEYTYDALGRKLTEKQVSDTYPAGLTTTYTYDTASRVRTVTAPATTDAVSGTRHQAQTVYDYDPDGNVLRTTVKDLLGGDPERVTTVEYDGSGRPEVAVDAEGGETRYGYDRFGNKTFMEDANGNRYEYAYTARNMMAEVRLRNWSGDPAGAPSTGDYLVLHAYSYDHAGRMTSDTDAMGRRLEYEYYQDDLLRRIVLKGFRNGDGSTRDYVVEENTYDGAGYLIKKVAANGTTITDYTVDKLGQIKQEITDKGGLGRATSFDYDPAGNVSKVTRSGLPSNYDTFISPGQDVVSYLYDDGGNMSQETVTSGTATQVTKYGYDRRGALVTVTDPRGNVTQYTNDELGQRIRSVAPAVPVESDGGPAQTVNPTTQIGYNTFGEAVAVRDPRGNVTRAEFDKLGRQTAALAPSYTPPGGVAANPAERTAYDPLGNVRETVDPRGNVTRYTYDQLNRVLTRDEPATTNDERAVWRYTYTRTGEVLSVTDPTGARVETTYDDLDRRVTLTQVERYPAGNLTTRYGYDDAGNVTTVTAPSGAVTTNVYDKLGQLVRSTDANGVVNQYGYDHAGRRARESDGLGRTSRVVYDGFGRRVTDRDYAPDGTVLRTQTYGYNAAGNLTTAKDAYETTTTYDYDALGRLTSQTEPTSAGASITTTFGYDAAGNRTRYTDGRSNATVYTYNVLGFPESVIEPATTAHPAASDRTWSVGYDLAGNPLKLTAPGGVTRDRAYDAAGRLQSETGVGAEAATAGRELGYDAVGRLTRVSAPGGDNTYTYNDRGALLSAAGPSGTASFGYDVDGLPTSRTDAAGTATFTYQRGRLHTVKDAVTGATQTLGYNAAGQESTVDYGSGRVRTFGYDNFGRLNSDVLRNTAGQTVSSVTYGFDLNHHLTGKTTTGTAGAGQHTYGYDLAGRLTSWTGPQGTTDYGWDASGNRVKAGTKTATFDERNRLLSDGDYTYSYTPRGTQRTRTSSGLVEEYSFDAFDRLVQGGGQAYTYDGLDRVATRGGTAFTYAGLSDEPVSDGAELYARGPTDELLAVAEGNVKRMTLADGHGDVVAQFDPADGALPALSDSVAYDPFGARLQTSGSTPTNVGYQGDWTDPATGQVDMGARWYQPTTGTFTSRDSVTYRSGDSILANRYTYAAGAPLDFADPDGHWPKWVRKAAGFVNRNVIQPVWSATVTVVRYAWSGLKTAANFIKSAATWVYDKAKSAVNSAIAATKKYIIDPAKQWAERRAAEMRAAYERAKQVTRAAKAAVSYAVKNSPMMALAAATKPLLTGMSKVVSAVASLPAQIVSTVRDVVVDAAKSVQAIYSKAVEAAGTVVTAVSKAVESASNWVVEHKAAIAGFVVGGIVGLACGAAIGWTGVGAVACGALAGAIGSAVTGYMNGQRGWDLVGTAAMGAVTGALGGALGSVAGQAIGAGVRAASGAISSVAGVAVRAAASSTRAAGAAIRSGGAAVRNAFSRGGSPAIRETPTKLHAFGKPREPRLGQDFVVGDDGLVVPQSGPLPRGASTFGDPEKAPLSGAYHSIPEGTELPEGLAVVADGVDVIPNSPHPETHHSIYPTRPMMPEEFIDGFNNLPWTKVGNIKKKKK